MADPLQTPATVEQQVASKTPATKQKNPKRVAAGKASAKKTNEAQKKARGTEKGLSRSPGHRCK